MCDSNLTNIEYEATFYDIDISEMRTKLKSFGGELIKSEFNQKRTVFNFPKGHEIKGGYIRVRDEADKITMTLKIMSSNNSIEGQKEVELVVDDYNAAINMLSLLGANKKSFQESKRELWEIDGVEIMLDSWPFLETLIEIEGKSELEVRKVSEKLGFNWNDAVFDSIDYFYCKKYNITSERINNNTPELRFDMDNPFLN